MGFNNYEIVSSDSDRITESWNRILDSYSESNKIKEQQQHEVKLKEMEIQSQKELVFNIGMILVFIIITIAIICKIYKNKNLKKSNKNSNSIKEKMEILNSLFEEGIITKEEFNIQKDKLKSKFTME